MDFSNYFPIWNKLTPAHQQRLTDSAELLKAKGGTVVHNGSMDCLGTGIGTDQYSVFGYPGRCPAAAHSAVSEGAYFCGLTGTTQ